MVALEDGRGEIAYLALGCRVQAKFGALCLARTVECNFPVTVFELTLNPPTSVMIPEQYCRSPSCPTEQPNTNSLGQSTHTPAYSMQYANAVRRRPL